MKKFEEELERMAPRRLPENLLARMEAAMDDWEEHDEKVVPFPSRAGESRLIGRGFLKAVAAVAVLGAALALMLPGGFKSAPETADRPNPSGSVLLAGISPASFAPQDAQRKLVSAADQGVVVTRDSRPHRVLRVESMDHYTFQNAKGEVLTMERPRVEFVLIPLETD
ncbi:MAG: hypothetical protein HKO57_03130 [Akkermansiaceae bacterium]|nr:hypothetical protein [Akkermansiaceae bacterium]